MTPAQATRLAKQITRAGFQVLGGFHPGPHDGVPDVRPGVPSATLLLVGNVGDGLWPVFQAAPEFADGRRDPLDRYTLRTLGAIAAEHGFGIAFAAHPPYPPIQRWALRCGGFSASPLGVLAHRRYGPWCGLRAALLSPQTFGEFPENGRTGPCLKCDRPCVTTCPVGAVRPESYDVAACATHVQGKASACRTGCLARVACPHGIQARPPAAQARLHMQAFLDLLDAV